MHATIAGFLASFPVASSRNARVSYAAHRFDRRRLVYRILERVGGASNHALERSLVPPPIHYGRQGEPRRPESSTGLRSIWVAISDADLARRRIEAVLAHGAHRAISIGNTVKRVPATSLCPSRWHQTRCSRAERPGRDREDRRACAGCRGLHPPAWYEASARLAAERKFGTTRRHRAATDGARRANLGLAPRPAPSASTWQPDDASPAIVGQTRSGTRWRRYWAASVSRRGFRTWNCSTSGGGLPAF